MRVLGIDFGKKRIGLAMSDELKMLATPLEVYERKHYNKDVTFVVGLIKQNKCETVIIGMPYHMNGQDSQIGELVKEFANSLKIATGCIIEYVDERLTSWQGEQIMAETGSKKKNLDSVSAAIILQTYLDSKVK